MIKAPREDRITMPAAVAAFYGGVAAKYGGGVPILSPEETIREADLRDAGDTEATGRIVEGHCRFVWDYMKEDGLVWNRNDDLTEEVFQCGLIGMGMAAETWDQTRGVKFPSWAVWRVRQQCMVAINTHRSPLSVNWTQVQAATKPNAGRRMTGQTKSEVFRAISPSKFVHLDQEASGGGPELGSEKSIFIPCPNSMAGFEEVEARDESDWIESIMLDVLTPREITALRMKFWGEATLLDIGNKFGVSRERVRQIIVGAAEKMRRRMVREKLSGDYDWSKIGGAVRSDEIQTGDIVKSKTGGYIGVVVGWQDYTPPRAVVELASGVRRTGSPEYLERIGRVA